MSSLVDTEAAPPGPEEPVDRPHRGAPPYTVFPALVVGLGDHGRKVVERLKKRLADEDPHLLLMVRLATLAGSAQAADVRIIDPGSGASERANRLSTEGLGAVERADSELASRLVQLCDSVGVHEDMQLLAEQGYSTFAYDDDLRVRLYIVCDLGDAASGAVLPSLARLLRSTLRQRAGCFSTLICIPREHEVEPPRDLSMAITEDNEILFERIYQTSAVKEFGYLAASWDELIAAQTLFLNTVLLSDAERAIEQSLTLRTGAGSFGVASVRLGTPEMAAWIRTELALSVIREGYLPRTGEVDAETDPFTGDKWLRERWRELLRDVSYSEASIKLQDGIPHISLASTSDLMAWSRDRVSEHLSDESEAVTPQPCPLPELLATLTRRVGDIEDRLRVELTDRLAEHLQTMPGPLHRGSDALERWEATLRKEAKVYVADPRASLETSQDGDILTWLYEEVDSVALRLQRARSEHAPALAVFTRLVMLIVLALACLRTLGFSHYLQVVIGAEAVLAAVVLVSFREWRRLRAEARLTRALQRSIERRLGKRLRKAVYQTLESLLEWVEGRETAIAHLRSDLETLAKRYEYLMGELDGTESSFLEQVIIDRNQRERCSEGIPLEELISSKPVRSIPPRVLLGIGERPETRDGLPTVSTDLESTQIDRALLAAVTAFAAPHLDSLYGLSLLQALAMRRFDDGQIGNHESLYADVTKQLRERALVLSGNVDGSALAPRPTASSSADELLLETVGSIAQESVNILVVSREHLSWPDGLLKDTRSPDYLQLVDNADNQVMTYLRTMHRPPEKGRS